MLSIYQVLYLWNWRSTDGHRTFQKPYLTFLQYLAWTFKILVMNFISIKPRWPRINLNLAIAHQIFRGVYFVPELYNWPKEQQHVTTIFIVAPNLQARAMEYLKICPFCALCWITFLKNGQILMTFYTPLIWLYRRLCCWARSEAAIITLST